MKKDDKIFLYDQIQQMAKRITGRRLSLKELRYLKAKIITEMQNLIIKINNSGVE